MSREQSLLTERRAAIRELSRETDKTAREMLQFRVDQIDRELYERSWRPGDGSEVRS